MAVIIFLAYLSNCGLPNFYHAVGNSEEGGLGAIFQLELGQKVGDMFFYRVFADIKCLGHLLVAQPRGQAV